MRCGAAAAAWLLPLALQLICAPAALRVSAVPSVPSGPSAAAVRLQAQLDAAQPGETIVVPPGEIVFSNVSLLVQGAENLTVVGRGVTLVFYFGFGVQVAHSRGCRFFGFTLDSSPPNYAQGIVQKVDGTTFDADFSDAFIPPVGGPFASPGGLSGAKTAFWDPTTKQMLPLGNQFMAQAARLPTPGRYRVTLKAPVRGAIVLGKTPVTIFGRRGITWNLVNSSQITTDGVTIHAGGNMGFHESGGLGGNLYRGVQIVRRPGSEGLLALNADGFHSDSVGLGPTLIDSEISFTGDDFLNIHNRMQVICKPLSADSLAILDISSLGNLAAGDKFSFWQLEPNCKGGCKRMNTKLGEGVVKSFHQVTEPGLLAECAKTYEAMQAPPYNASLVIHALPKTLHQVTFSTAVPSAVVATRYNLAQWDSRSSLGAVVQRNHFHDGFSRMGLLKAGNMTYTDNVCERAGGLHVFSEQEWLEGDLGIENVTLRNVTVTDPTSCGALNASACFAAPGHFIQVMSGLSGLTCERNTFNARGDSQAATDGHPGYCHPRSDGGGMDAHGNARLKLDDVGEGLRGNFRRPARSSTCDDSVLGLTEVAWHSEPSHIYLGSPSILRLPNRTILITADRFGDGFKGQPRNVSLYVSDDEGESWRFHTWILREYWANLFSHQGKIYLLGTSQDGPAPIKISSSVDGLTWAVADTAYIDNATYNTGPTPTLVSGGRVWRAMEAFVAPHVWGKDYEAMFVHAAADSDLMDPASWTVSESLRFNVSWLPADFGQMSNPGYLEGNAVEGPDGEVYNILRLNSLPVLGNHAIKLRFDKQANKFEFDRLLYLPGGHTKFVIRRDDKTKLYFTLSNNNTDAVYTDQRNVLVLCVSSDLNTWTILRTLLADDTGLAPADSVRYTGFHYVDWQFDGADGEDIIYAVRTAYRGAESYHNSNRITFKTLKNYRALASGLLTLGIGGAQLQPPFERDVLHYTASLDANATVISVTLGGTGTFQVNGKQVKVAAGSATAVVPFSANSTTVAVKDVSTGDFYTVDCERTRPASVHVTGSGFSIGDFKNGSLAFSDREYVWRAVPPAVTGWYHTRTNGGQGIKGAAAAVIHVDVLSDCTVYATVGVSTTAAHAVLVKEGFEETKLEVEYTDANDTPLKLYRRAVVQGAQFSLDQRGSGWYGVQLVFP